MPLQGKMMNRIVALLLFVLLLVAGPVSAQQATPEPGTPTPATPISGPLTETAVHIILPIGQTGLHTSFNVFERVAGACDLPSVADPGRPDARRCNVEGGGVLDPCFVSPFATPGDLTIPLACLRDPFTSDVSLLTLLQKYDPTLVDSAPDTLEDSPPWALKLANGISCVAMTGATFGVAGLRANYTCDDGGVLIGDPTTSGPLWFAHHLERGAVATNRIAVAEAWY